MTPPAFAPIFYYFGLEKALNDPIYPLERAPPFGALLTI
jgi:hypothetical protein